ncbi:MAG: HNH endonuclease [Candidatus Saccharibacteria bacterium]|nr:HNH endonuclease [Candidatus Saccharibacteria bacterium]
MMKIDAIAYTHIQAIELCHEGITGNPNLHAKLAQHMNDLGSCENVYLRSANTGELYTIPALDPELGQDPVVVGNLLKSELNKFYTNYFVPEKKPARKIYDALLNSAQEDCPFCGGIGTPRNLDHFLPKAHFPQFSILPANLVPSCLDCNLAEKKHAYSSRPEDQIIQPYLDQPHFFSEQWVYAKFEIGDGNEPGQFEYFVNPPPHWKELDKKRAKKHFDDFNIARRYSKQAAKQLRVILSQIDRMQSHGVSKDEIINDLLVPGMEGATFINHWQFAMYQALINSDF